VRAFALRALDLLQGVHAAGQLHRDVKPADFCVAFREAALRYGEEVFRAAAREEWEEERLEEGLLRRRGRGRRGENQEGWRRWIMSVTLLGGAVSGPQSTTTTVVVVAVVVYSSWRRVGVLLAARVPPLRATTATTAAVPPAPLLRKKTRW
jgi:hypothetical protein